MTLEHRLNTVIDAALGSRIIGCVVRVNQNGQTVFCRAAGYADREKGMAMAVDSIFRLASVTKPIVSTAALRMMELGRLQLDDPVTRFLPWFTPMAPDGSVPAISLRHLLTHTSGITYDVPATVAGGLSGPNIALEENLRRLAQVPLAFMPGSRWAYGMGIDVIGGVLAAIHGSTLEDAVATHVTGPLGMKDTHFHVTDRARLTVPYADGTPPMPMGENEPVPGRSGGVTVFSPDRIHDPNAPQSGGAGMAGTAGDVMKLLEEFSGAGKLLRPETVAMALSNQIGAVPRDPADPGKRFSLIGARLEDPHLATSPCPVGTADWGGAYGHNWLIDPTNRISIVTCTNTAFEGCNGPFREEVRDAVYG